MKRLDIFSALAALVFGFPVLAQPGTTSPTDKWSWGENCGWMDWFDAGSPAGSQGPRFQPEFASGFVWCENIGWINLGNGNPANGVVYTNASGNDFGVNYDLQTGSLSGMAWGENVGWINFAAGGMANPPHYARIDYVHQRLTGYVWGENIGWINLEDAARFVGVAGFPGPCGSADFNCDGDTGTDMDIEAFFACIAGLCPPLPCASTADFDGDGDVGTDGDIEAFFRVLAGGNC